MTASTASPIPLVTLAVALAGAALPAAGAAQDSVEADGATSAIFGVKVRVGGRFDNVRMCVASDPGVKGGPAADVSLFADIGVDDGMSVEFDLPVMRPILFAAAFRMLQFEPSVTLKFRSARSGSVAFVGGPTLGLSLHYGPDYESGQRDDDRGPSFFALGPTIGGYLGLDFARPEGSFDFQLGLTPYVTPLFGVNDPDDHRGVVIGGLLDGAFRFDPGL